MITIDSRFDIGYPMICIFDGEHEVEGDNEWDEDDIASKGEYELLLVAEPYEPNQVLIFVDEEIDESLTQSSASGSHILSVPSQSLIIEIGWNPGGSAGIRKEIKCSDKVKINYFVDSSTSLVDNFKTYIQILNKF